MTSMIFSEFVYPSGRTVEYRPDALGRPTQAAPYVDAIPIIPAVSSPRSIMRMVSSPT